jgi:hypothetical protein
MYKARVAGGANGNFRNYKGIPSPVSVFNSTVLARDRSDLLGPQGRLQHEKPLITLRGNKVSSGVSFMSWEPLLLPYSFCVELMCS